MQVVLVSHNVDCNLEQHLMTLECMLISKILQKLIRQDLISTSRRAGDDREGERMEHCCR